MTRIIVLSIYNNCYFSKILIVVIIFKFFCHYVAWKTAAFGVCCQDPLIHVACGATTPEFTELKHRHKRAMFNVLNTLYLVTVCVCPAFNKMRPPKSATLTTLPKNHERNIFYSRKLYYLICFFFFVFFYFRTLFCHYKIQLFDCGMGSH